MQIQIKYYRIRDLYLNNSIVSWWDVKDRVYVRENKEIQVVLVILNKMLNILFMG